MGAGMAKGEGLKREEREKILSQGIDAIALKLIIRVGRVGIGRRGACRGGSSTLIRLSNALFQHPGDFFQKRVCHGVEDVHGGEAAGFGEGEDAEAG